MLALACLVLPLAACGPSEQTVPSQLPHPPADIQSCFRSAVGLPDKDLTIAEVEALWKVDRYRLAVNKRCGVRLLQWYESLRVNWK